MWVGQNLVLTLGWKFGAVIVQRDKGGTDRILFSFISHISHFCTTFVPKQIWNAWHTLLDIGLWMWNAFYSETFMFFLEVTHIDFQSTWMNFSSSKKLKTVNLCKKQRTKASGALKSLFGTSRKMLTFAANGCILFVKSVHRRCLFDICREPEPGRAKFPCSKL